MSRHCKMMKSSGVAWIKDIPADWGIRALFQLSGQVKNKNKDLGEKNLLSLSYGKIKRKDINSSDGLLPESFDGYNIIEGNDIVLRLTDLQNDHTSLRVGQAEERGIITSAYITLRPTSLVNSKYLYYVMHSYDLVKGFYGMGSGVRQGLNYNEVKTIKVPFPKIAEQTAIAAYLDDKCKQVYAIISEIETSIEEYKKWKSSVIFEAVTKGLNSAAEMKDSGVKWIGKVPRHWIVTNLGYHTRMLTPMRDKPPKLDGPIPWIRIEDYDGKYIDHSKENLGVSIDTINQMNLKIYPIGTVLCTSSCDLGKCAIVNKELVSNQRFIGIIPQQAVRSDYLYYVMLSNAKRLNYLSQGTIQANLSRIEFEHLKIQFPPLIEQQEIADYLDKKCAMIDAIITEKEALIVDLEAYKRALIYEAVTGKRKVV